MDMLPLLARALICVLVLSAAGCESRQLALPDPPRDGYRTMAYLLPGCAVASVPVHEPGPTADGGSGGSHLHGDDDWPARYLSTSQLCFAVTALRAWVDAAPLETFLQPGDSERIVVYWRETDPSIDPGAPRGGGSFVLAAEIPGRRTRTVRIEVERSLSAVSFTAH